MKNYGGIQKFRVEHEPTGGEIVVEIDFNYTEKYREKIITQLEQIEELQSFWYGSKEKLSDEKGDYVKAFLKQLCQECLAIALEGNWNSDGVRDKFVNKEGYCRLDGSAGIKLLSITLMELADYEQYNISAL